MYIYMYIYICIYIVQSTEDFPEDFLPQNEKSYTVDITLAARYHSKTSSFLHYSLAVYTVNIPFKCIWGLGSTSKDKNIP